MNQLERRQILRDHRTTLNQHQEEQLTWLDRFKSLPQWIKREHHFVVTEAMDKQLLFSALALTIIGFVMVSSATMDTVAANEAIADAYYYPKRLLIFYAIGCLALYVCMLIPITVWHQNSLLIFVLGLIGLIAVVLLGTEVNGAKRWLAFGSFKLQVSEFAKVAMMIVMAGYIVRQQQNIRTHFYGFLFGMIFVAAFCLVLVYQKDLGAMVVLIAAVCGMFFLCGVKYRHIFYALALLSVAVLLLILASSYRVVRLTTFANPWADPYGDGYQIVQSQIALGQGGWFGVGLGNSVQKLFYLPEPHNDFILSVITEEWGAIGAIVVMFVVGVFIFRGLKIGQTAEQLQRFYAAYLSYGLILVVAAQAIINISVNLRMLPNKGLTLPFVSYGGSSFLACCIILGILMRVSMENQKCIRQQTRQAIDNEKYLPDRAKVRQVNYFAAYNVAGDNK